MLTPLNDELRRLAADPGNHYTSIIRRLAGPREAVRYEEPLRRLVLSMPGMIRRIGRWNREAAGPARLRRLQGFALDSVCRPVDFLPAHGAGLFGYLDDAYLLAGVCISGLEFEGSGRRGNGAAARAELKRLAGWMEAVRRILPSEAARMDRALESASRGPSRAAGRSGRRPRRGAAK